jgi:mannose-6-phosphate isomerase-like protein (cupin superfamily)
VGEPVLVEPGGGELIGDSPERRLEILCEDDALHATWSRFGPGRVGTDLHVHRRHADVFYVLDGELTVRMGVEDESVVAPAGTLALVPPMVVHGFRNGSDDDVRYLNFHAPGTGFAAYLRGLRDGTPVAGFDQEPPPAEGVRPASDAAVSASGSAELAEIGLAVLSVEGGDEPHVHRHLECLYVLAGECSVLADGRELRAVAGSWVQLPSGVAHVLAPAGGAPCRVLEVRAPSS